MRRITVNDTGHFEVEVNLFDGPRTWLLAAPPVTDPGWSLDHDLAQGWAEDVGVAEWFSEHDDEYAEQCLRKPFAALMSRDLPEWMRRDASSLASSEFVVARCAALGLIGRLWMPPTRRGVLDEDPDVLALKVINSMATYLLVKISKMACTWATALIEQRKALPNPSSDTYLRSLTELAIFRDDMESVFFVLANRGLDEDLAEVLKVVDDSMPTFPTGLLRSERLAAVSELEPTAWWGRLANERE